MLIISQWKKPPERICKGFYNSCPLPYSGGWGLAAAGNTEITAADRVAFTGESSRRKGESPSPTARYGQRPRSSLHQQLCGPRNPESLQWSSVCVLLHLLIYYLLKHDHLHLFRSFFSFLILCFFCFYAPTINIITIELLLLIIVIILYY